MDMSSNDIKSAEEISPQRTTPLTEDVKKEPEAILANGECCPKQGTTTPRRAALSKRELMEELSRQRFPWEE
jgi:hypothetical protein